MCMVTRKEIPFFVQQSHVFTDATKPVFVSFSPQRHHLVGYRHICSHHIHMYTHLKSQKVIIQAFLARQWTFIFESGQKPLYVWTWHACHCNRNLRFSFFTLSFCWEARQNFVLSLSRSSRVTDYIYLVVWAKQAKSARKHLRAFLDCI
jgi:hypothetical protein